MLANLLTLLRLVLAAGFAAGVALAGPGHALSAGWLTLLLILAGGAELTDLLDGPLARARGAAGRVGGLLDPLCDALSRLTLYFAAALAGWVALAVPLVMVGRDLLVAYCRVFQAYMNWPTSARFSGKAKAVIQGSALLALVVLAGRQESYAQPARLGIGALVIAVTLWSLFDYLRLGIPAALAMHRQDRRQGQGRN